MADFIMMQTHWTNWHSFYKPFFVIFMMSILPLMNACSTNPATGKSQFAGLMSPQQEVKVGASEHQKVMQQFGSYDNAAVIAYVNKVGQKVSKNTERADVQYKFFVIDSPITNAFALPGGYIYVSRGLLALANSEAELAAVLGHETGHITGRHSAERYSRGVVTSLGAAVLSAALGSDSASQALGVGSDLLIKSYSRGQENEADTLGIRYLSRSGYDPKAMTWFLSNLQSDSVLQGKIAGRSGAPAASYFSTHPATSERVAKTVTESQGYNGKGIVNREAYLRAIDGVPYGDSEKQGFVRGQNFYHTVMGFTFSAPDGFTISNQPQAVVATNKSGAVVLFDIASNKQNTDPATYLTQMWMKDEKLTGVERIKVNGLEAASAGFQGRVNGKPMTIRLVAVKWGDNFARFQVAIPSGASQGLVDGLKRTTYSFRALSAKEKKTIQPYKLRVITAKAGDTAASLGRRMPFDTLQEERFRVLNGLIPGEALKPGRKYKIVSGG